MRGTRSNRAPFIMLTSACLGTSLGVARLICSSCILTVTLIIALTGQQCSHHLLPPVLWQLYGDTACTTSTGVWRHGLHNFHRCVETRPAQLPQAYGDTACTTSTGVWRHGLHNFHRCMTTLKYNELIDFPRIQLCYTILHSMHAHMYKKHNSTN